MKNHDKRIHEQKLQNTRFFSLTLILIGSSLTGLHNKIFSSFKSLCTISEKIQTIRIYLC